MSNVLDKEISRLIYGVLSLHLPIHYYSLAVYRPRP
nr:MAG TPA: hypothetical protein [Caudoviricetes sp.]